MERRRELSTDTQHTVNLSAYAWAVERLRPLSGARVLDAACGAGFGSYAVAGDVERIVGVDLSVPAVVEAAGLYGRSNLSFAAMDCSRLGFRDAQFDAVLSFETIEHVSDDDQYVEEISRVLRPGGMLLLSTPRAPSPGGVPDNPFHLREYAWDELEELLARHFQTVVRFGRRLGPRLARIEEDLDRVRALAPAKLRQIVPRQARHTLGSMISRARGGVGLGEVTVDDVEYIEGLEESSTLLAICQGH
jgi:SAM-dependent methyltransferase